MHSYFECHNYNPNSTISLFCFPHAGGGADIYYDWSNFIRSEINIYILNLPGRGKKYLEKSFEEFNVLLDNLLIDIEDLLDKPFIIFGHSMGALIGFELSRRIFEMYNKKPEHLYVSSYPSPEIINNNLVENNISDDELITKLKELNGTPKEIFQHKRFLKLLLPVIRADFKLLNSYSYKELAPLSCPITSIIGSHDNISVELAKEWYKHSVAVFSLQIFRGDHFYLNNFEAKKKIGKLIEKDFMKINN